MTTLVIVLGVLIFAVIGLGVGLLKLSRGSSSFLHEGKLAQTRVHSYAAMTRLFDGRDLTFLKTQPGYRPGMARRLRLHRRQALSLYLTQAHHEFRQFWFLCREFTARTNNPEMAAAAFQQYTLFYALYLTLKIQYWVSLALYVPMDARKLVGLVQTLQRNAREAARQTSPVWSGLAAGNR